MRLPFTTEQFLGALRRYNEAVWPTQWLLVALAALGICAALWGTPRAGRLVSGMLAALWTWMALAYHVAFFRAINPVGAATFAVTFIAQAALLAWVGVARDRLAFHVRPDAAGIAGGILLLYALIVYPLLSGALGHVYPVAPTFGLPCPTTIYTLGILLWATPRAPRTLFVIPILWAAVGTSAALQLGMREDFGLVAAVVMPIIVLVLRPRHASDGVSAVGRRPSRAGVASSSMASSHPDPAPHQCTREAL